MKGALQLYFVISFIEAQWLICHDDNTENYSFVE